MLILDEHSKTPLYAQLYEHIKTDILSGAIKAGQKLKSSRAASAELHISRNTVDLAYGQLFAEGFIAAEPRKGYYAEALNIKLPQQCESAHNAEAAQKPERNIMYDFRCGKLLLSELPCNQWQKLTARCFLDYRENLARQGSAFGELGLRLEIQKYIRNYRDVACAAEQIIVTPGTQFSLDIVCRLLKSLNNGLAIAMEEPGYEQSRVTFQSGGLNVCPICLDRCGLMASALESSDVAAAYITPHHQYPTGIVMPMSRRAELAALAERKDILIIEDDYNCHFQHSQRPIPSLQSLCTDKTVYIGGFSDIMLPCIQVAYMIVPDRLLAQLHRWYDSHAPFVPFLTQKPLELFMQEGHWERHLRKMRKIQKLKCEALVNALKDKFGDSILLSGFQTGLHLLVQAKWPVKEDELVYQARKIGVGVYPTSNHWSRPKDAANGTVLLNYGGISLTDIPLAAELLYSAWRKK
jgi:GntR family transcriptional regulator/MocR family aminotransferase